MENVPAVILERVSKRFGTGSQTVTALTEVSLRIPAGEFLSIMGPSGSGKSTLLSLIAGLDVPTSGRVMLAGHELAELPDSARSDLRLRAVGFVFQNFSLFPTFTVEQNVAWPLEVAGLGWRVARERAAEALVDVGLDLAVRDRRPTQLSRGEQQRVAIARALVTDPQVLLADEPTGNLDSATGQATLDLIHRLNRERAVTVVLVTHNVLAATYGHRTVELRDGRIVYDVRAPREAARVVPIRD